MIELAGCGLIHKTGRVVPKENHDEMRVWEFGGKAVAELAGQLAPHLLTKRRQAEIIAAGVYDNVAWQEMRVLNARHIPI